MEPIGRSTLLGLLQQHGIADAVLFDELYALPSLEWLAGEGAKAIYARCVADVGLPEPNAADCDDYARCVAEEIRTIHRGTEGHAAAAIAFGIAPYVRTDGRGHCINVFAYRDGELRLGFFEPNPTVCAVVSLTPEEIRSCALPEF